MPTDVQARPRVGRHKEFVRREVWLLAAQDQELDRIIERMTQGEDDGEPRRSKSHLIREAVAIYIGSLNTEKL